ncbi:MAG TPA: SagB/ThcOx family dehydrogenase [Methylomirabilota bacterium]|nr:SagB/ThcOx family dehydrogenase [Methylomirabilota bacterium]
MARPAESVEAVGARAYHDATKHSSRSVRESAHFLDWENKPFLFKVYPAVPATPLPREVAAPTRAALDALAAVASSDAAGLDVPTLAQLLFFAAGLTKKKVYGGGETVHFRAAASTGALYEVEVYVVAGAVVGLEPGVYHFSPGDFALRRLRAGDYRAVLRDLASEPTRVAEAPACLVLSAIYWRNTWKYQARAYRHFFWDAGTLLANLLATAAAANVPARVLLGFADAEVNRLLGLDPGREAGLALVPLGAGAAPPPAAPAVEPLELATVPLSPREVDYPLIGQAYAGSSLANGAAARAWLGRPPSPAPSPAAPVSHSLVLAEAEAGPPLGSVILRRGSTRQFSREPIAVSALSRILDVAVRELPLDLGGGAELVECYLLVHAVEGLPAGAYVFDSARRGLRQLRAGEFRQEGGYLCLEQALGADASAVVFFVADLGAVLARYGDRGYRAVNLLAGLYGGRMYLAAYALGLGASGLTFYDDEVVRFFSPDAAGKDAIFVTALGRAWRGRPGGLGQAAGAVEALRPGEA